MTSALTVRDALERLAALAAISDLVKQQQDELRGYLRDEAARIETETGTAANLNVKGVARAYMTQPGERIRVIDEDAWCQWARANYPERCLHRPRLHPTRFWSWLADHSIVEAELREVGVLDEEILPETGLEDEVAATASRREDGVLVHAETGEVLPLRAVQASAPVLTVRVDAKHRERLLAQLRLPELEEAGA